MDSDGGLNTPPPSNHASAHKCNICSKAFSRYTDLRRHTDAVHLKIKNFKCADCGKSFAQKIGLQTHMNSHSGNAPYECRVKCGHPPFRDPSSRGRHEYEKHAPPGFECPEGCGSFKRKDALKSHIFHCHRAKAFTYTDEQLSNKMTRARFNEVFLRPAIAEVKARRRAEGYVSDEDYENPGSASEGSGKPVVVFSGPLLAAAATAPSQDDDFIEIEEKATSLDPDQTSGLSEHHDQGDVPMKADRSPSPFGQWVRARDAQKALSHSPLMQTTPSRSAEPSPPISRDQSPYSPQRSSPLRTAPIVVAAAPRLAPTELPSNAQTSRANTPFPTMTSPIGTLTNGNVLGLDFGGSGGGGKKGLPYFSSTSVAPVPAFPTQPTIDPTKHYYRRVVGLPVGSHGQGFFSSPPSLMGSPTLRPAHQAVDVNTTTLGGLSPSSRGVMDPSFLDDEIII
ncbi:hypothetical protein FRC04_008433 [Tulasnella sp. 424]|nr:hypothetical protein FRC04_008433 [Tulasnella sp. 424]KAG8976803.1 hypothetical protein FRC05_003153 [Tulasnella sp. 425]